MPPVSPNISTWQVSHAPAANTTATATKAAVAGHQHVVSGFTVSLCAQAAAPAAVQLTVSLVSGSTTLWGPMPISLPGVAGAMALISVSNKRFVGQQNEAMTLAFSAGGGANTIEGVAMDGFSI